MMVELQSMICILFGFFYEDKVVLTIVNNKDSIVLIIVNNKDNIIVIVNNKDILLIIVNKTILF
jgi:hypothetical protein